MSTRVVYGIPTDDSGMAIRFGADRGLFSKRGIDIEFRTIHGGPELASALDSGEISIGQLGSPPAITAIGQGKRFRIVASSTERGAAFFLVVRPGLRDWTDLKGKVAGALSKGSCGYWYMWQILAQHGIDPDGEVEIRSLGADYGNQVKLLQEGTIDMILATEPFATLAEETGAARYWGSVQEVGDVDAIQWIVEVANIDFIEREPELARAVLDGIAESSNLALSNLDEWAEFWAAIFDVSEAAAGRAIRRQLPFLQPHGIIDRAGLANALTLQHELGATDRILAIADIVDERFQVH